MRDVVRFGVVGCGSIAGLVHLPVCWADSTGAVVAAVCDVDRAAADAAASRWEVSGVYTQVEDMLAAGGLDAVIVASPNYLHRRHAVAAAKAGLHVLVEKPLAVTRDEAWAIVEACEAAGVKLMVGCDRRFWTHNRWAKELIDAGVIGRPWEARGSLHEHWREYPVKLARTDFRQDPARAGGGALPDLGAHTIDLVTWLLGSAARRVAGFVGQVGTDESVSTCDDLAVVVVEHDSGAVSSLSCNRFSPVVSQATDVYGTDGTIHTATDATNPFQSVPLAVYTDRPYAADGLPGLLADYRWPVDFWAEDLLASSVPRRWVPIIPPRRPSNYESMLAHFVSCILEDTAPLVSGADGARAVEVMCAVHHVAWRRCLGVVPLFMESR